MFDEIKRPQISSFFSQFSLFVFVLAGLGVIAFIIKSSFFHASSSKGYVAFIIINSVLAGIFQLSSRYLKNDRTNFAIWFDNASGAWKAICLSLYAVLVITLYELLKYFFDS